jgi:hypothetical protein
MLSKRPWCGKPEAGSLQHFWLPGDRQRLLITCLIVAAHGDEVLILITDKYCGAEMPQWFRAHPPKERQLIASPSKSNKT